VSQFWAARRYTFTPPFTEKVDFSTQVRGFSCGYYDGARRIYREAIEIAIQFWYYRARIEQECIRKSVIAHGNADNEVKWEIPAQAH
jgi:hypothetical protein